MIFKIDIKGEYNMSVKDLLKAELDFLSEADLQELYEIAKSRSLKLKNRDDDLGDLLEQCKVQTGISDLAEQHDHYIHGTAKKNEILADLNKIEEMLR
jgi:hypothetical protein